MSLSWVILVICMGGRLQRTLGFKSEKHEDHGQNGEFPASLEIIGPALLARDLATLGMAIPVILKSC